MSWKKHIKPSENFSIVPVWFAELMKNNAPKEQILARIDQLFDEAFKDEAELANHPARAEWKEMMYGIYLEQYQHG